MKAKQILFIGLSSVGDVIMTSPVLQSLNNKYPEAVMDVIGDNRSREIYKQIPFVRDVYIKDKNKPLRGAPDLIKQLWKRRYDLIVDVRTDGLAYLLRGKRKYTKWFKKSYGEHAVEDLMGVIFSIHGNEPIGHTKIWLAENHRDYANEKLSCFDAGRVLALSVGTEDKLFKTWPEEKFIELCNLHKDDFSGVVFLGNEQELERTEKIIEQINIPSLNTAGNSLLEAAALLEKVFLYIGPDSGLGHIASAMNTNTISFFSVVSPARYKPWGEKAAYVVGENNDARNIPVDSVSKLVDRVLDNKAG